MLNNAFAPSRNQILENARDLFVNQGEDAVLDYLSEVASNDFKCPDKCDRWAADFYQDYQEDIENGN